jgi:hypothetical protein
MSSYRPKISKNEGRKLQGSRKRTKRTTEDVPLMMSIRITEEDRGKTVDQVLSKHGLDPEKTRAFCEERTGPETTMGDMKKNKVTFFRIADRYDANASSIQVFMDTVPEWMDDRSVDSVSEMINSMDVLLKALLRAFDVTPQTTRSMALALSGPPENGQVTQDIRDTAEDFLGHLKTLLCVFRADTGVEEAQVESFFDMYFKVCRCQVENV